MLASDIDMKDVTDFQPIGDASSGFQGVFNGLGHVIKHLDYTTDTGQYAGLFGVISGGSVYDLGVVDSHIETKAANGAAGSIAGRVVNMGTDRVGTTVGKLYSEGGTVKAPLHAGGLFGELTTTDNATRIVQESYNTSAVETTSATGYAGGITGFAGGSSMLIYGYNTGAITSTDSNNKHLYGYGYLDGMQSYVHGFYTVAKDAASFRNAANYAQSTPRAQGALSFTEDFAKDVNHYDGYSTWGYASASGGVISLDGSKENAVWRMYQGVTTPLLMSMLKGNVTTEYNYNYFAKPGDADATKNGLELAQSTTIPSSANHGADVTGIYNAQYAHIAGKSDATKAGTVDDVTLSSNADPKLVSVSSGVRDVVQMKDLASSGYVLAAQPLLYSSQHGYNLVGASTEIQQKEVSVNLVADPQYVFTKVYDGTPDATAAFNEAMKIVDLEAGTSRASDIGIQGVFAEDLADSDRLTIKASKATYDTQNVTADDNNYVTVQNLDFNGTAKGNYKLPSAINVSNAKFHGRIKPRTLYLKVDDPADLIEKTYDGTTALPDNDAVSEAFDLLSVVKKGADEEHSLVSGDREPNLKDCVTDVQYDGTNVGKHEFRFFTPEMDTGNYRLAIKDGVKTGEDLLLNEKGPEGKGIWFTTKNQPGRINPRVVKFELSGRNGTDNLVKPYDGTTNSKIDGTYDASDWTKYLSFEGNKYYFYQDNDLGKFPSVTIKAVYDTPDVKRTGATADTPVAQGQHVVTYTIQLSEDFAKNYTLDAGDVKDRGFVQTLTGKGTITPITLGIAASGAEHKVYDGTANINPKNVIFTVNDATGKQLAGYSIDKAKVKGTFLPVQTTDDAKNVNRVASAVTGAAGTDANGDAYYYKPIQYSGLGSAHERRDDDVHAPRLELYRQRHADVHGK